MRLITIVLALIAMARPAESQRRTAMDSVRRLDSLYANAYATHDTVFARQIFADDFVMTAGNGTMKDREGELGDIRRHLGARRCPRVAHGGAPCRPFALTA